MCFLVGIFFLSVSLNEAHASRDYLSFFLSPDFYELWRSQNDSLSSTEVVGATLAEW